MTDTHDRLRNRISAVRASRPVAAARSVAGRGLRLASGARVRTRTALPRRGYVPGVLSVVVPCYDVEAYLDECLVSLRFQKYRNVEIIVVDDGSPDACADIARSHARRDPRVRLVRRENGGLSAARNTGVEHAHGEFLTFVDSDDVVQPEAFSAPLAALRESGSDFAMTHYDRVDRGQRKPAERWIQRAHAHRRLRVTVDDFPDAMVNAVAWTKTYRRTFWDDAGLSFPVGKLYEDQPVSMKAFGVSRAFDVVPEIGISWRIRHDRSSISQASSTVRNLAAHSEAVQTSLDALREAGRNHAAELRALQILANNMPFFTRHILKADDEFWDLLSTAIGDLVAGISPELYIRQVGAQNKVLYELIINGRKEDAQAFLKQFGTDARRFPSTVQPDGIHATLPLSEGLPADATRFSDRQLELIARVLRVCWSATGDLVIGGWAYLRNVDLADNPSELSVELVAADGSRIPFAVARHDEPRLDAVGEHWFCNYRPGGFTATLDAGRVPTEGDWAVTVRLEAAGVLREGPVSEVSWAGSAAVPRARVSGDARVVCVERVGRVLTVSARAVPVAVTAATVDDTGRLALTLTADEPRLVTISDVDDVRPLASASPTRVGDAWTASLQVPTTPGTSNPSAMARPLRIRVTTESGSTTDALAPPGTLPSPGLPTGPGARALSHGPHGELELLDRLPVATDFTLTDDELAVTVVNLPTLPGWRPTLRVGGDQVTGRVEPGPDGSQLLRFSLVTSRWGREGLALRPGKYAVGLLPPGAETAVPVVTAAELVDRLPVDLELTRYSANVELYHDWPPSLALLLREPLASDERGPRHQRRLRDEHRVPVADQDSVFFRALYGEVANCNGLGVHQELLARGADLTLYWSIRDHSVPVPPGGVGVIEGSRAWHEALARSRYHMVNVHQLDWFEKPEGQVIIETMHGYPYKVMGHEWWQKGGFPGGQIANYDRRAREWDYFVSPASYATPLLQRAFLDPAGSKAEVLEIGYPRNDVLLSDEAEELRRRTREQLGARDGQTVVMYAPTFRDYLSADDMTAKAVDFFDVHAASRALGDGYLILVRGHAFNARARSRTTSRGTVVDVTDHPDINDLILASDAAVLDYSSLRFDYAITGKPMIFLVPDLAQYDHARGGVIDFAPTAPGPHVTTTREVVRHLRDMPALRATTEPQIAEFRKAYVDLDDGRAAARLVDAVFVPRGDARPR